jgi:excisionase family DNA binding protein
MRILHYRGNDMSVVRLPRFLLVDEAAERAQVSPSSIRKEIHDGRLRARRVGRCLPILDEDPCRLDDPPRRVGTR